MKWPYLLFQNWIASRTPRVREVTLNQRSIYIFPSLQGGFFLCLLFALLLAAINYENSMAYALVFLLLSLFIVTILHSYSNLSGLCLIAGHCKPAFVGESAEFSVILRRRGARKYHGIQLKWPRSDAVIIDLESHREDAVKLFVRAEQRGRMMPGRLLVESYYPLGLFRCWSWVNLDMHGIVYPKVVDSGRCPQAAAIRNEGKLIEHLGNEDFYGFREYLSGDSLKHVSWRHYAKGQNLQTKQYIASIEREVWLDWDAFEGVEKEMRLSRLCHMVLMVAKTDDEYGLCLPGVKIQPGKGEQHQHELLRTLAFYDLPAPEKKRVHQFKMANVMMGR